MDDSQNPISTVKLVITGKLSYEDEITVNQAAQIIAFIDSSSGGNLAVPASTTRLAPAQITRPVLTPREAIDNSDARTNPEKITAFAGKILAEGKETFTLDDIRPLFRQAREAPPKNLSRDLDVVIRSGWAVESEERGEFYLTRKGLDILEQGFSKEKPSRRSNGGSSKSRNGSARKAKVIEVPELFKAHDPVPTTIDGLPSFVSLSGRKERFLWVLALAKSLGADGLTNQEIVWATDHLGAGIAANNINSAFTAARKADHVNRSIQTGKIRITPQGEDWLKSLL